jgi:hypothetical protein
MVGHHSQACNCAHRREKRLGGGREQLHLIGFHCEGKFRLGEWLQLLYPGGNSHLEISVIPVLRHSLYTCKYSHGARAWQGFVVIMSM